MPCMHKGLYKRKINDGAHATSSLNEGKSYNKAKESLIRTSTAVAYLVLPWRAVSLHRSLIKYSKFQILIPFTNVCSTTKIDNQSSSILSP